MLSSYAEILKTPYTTSCPWRLYFIILIRKQAVEFWINRKVENMKWIQDELTDLEGELFGVGCEKKIDGAINRHITLLPLVPARIE
jgi:hypothetical protein